MHRPTSTPLQAHQLCPEGCPHALPERTSMHCRPSADSLEDQPHANGEIAPGRRRFTAVPTAQFEYLCAPDSIRNPRHIGTKIVRNSLKHRGNMMARPERFELPTPWFVVGGGENLGQDEKRRYLILLSQTSRSGMAFVAIVTTEHDETGSGPANLPQPPGCFSPKRSGHLPSGRGSGPES